MTLRDFTGMSDVEKPILALPNHWIDIPGKYKKNNEVKKAKLCYGICKITDTIISQQCASNIV